MSCLRELSRKSGADIRTSMEDEMRNLLLILVVVIIVSMSSAALAGGPAFPGFYLWVNEIPGRVGTGSNIEAWVGNEENIPFTYPANSDQFTVAYWISDRQKLTAQSFTSPYPSGNYQWEGFLEVGLNDPRTSLTFDWFIYNNQSSLAWAMFVYRVDTRARVFYKIIQPEDGSLSGTITVPMSRQGYDLLVAAWDDNPSAVPEPGSVLALGTGLMALLGFATRWRYKV